MSDTSRKRPAQGGPIKLVRQRRIGMSPAERERAVAAVAALIATINVSKAEPPASDAPSP